MTSQATDDTVRRPLLVEAILRWWRLLPVLWPAVLVGYLAGWACLLLERPESSADALPRAVLLLGASWFGLLWAAAACAEEAPPRIGSILRRVQVAGVLPWLVAAIRAGMVYGPALLVYGVGAARHGVEQQVGEVNPVPAMALVLLPLTLILASLFALLPAVMIVDRPAGVSAALNRAKQLGDPMLAPLMAWGGLLLTAILLTSWTPTESPRLLPNQVIGSLLWVLVAVTAERAREMIDDGFAG